MRAGRVDVIVVYKVDRLTRSLADFAKLVELFDGHGTSFVSVTQAFNTTTSMGQRARLLQGIANGRRWLDELIRGTMPGTDTIAARESCSERHVRTMLNLAFLSPKIVKAAVDGSLPVGCGLVSLSETSMLWTPA